MNFKHIGEEEYAYIHVGSWDQGGLKMNDEEIWSNNSDVIQSVCSEPCQKAQIKVRAAERGVFVHSRLTVHQRIQHVIVLLVKQDPHTSLDSAPQILQSKKIPPIRSSSARPGDSARLFVQALITSLGFCSSPLPIQITENSASPPPLHHPNSPLTLNSSYTHTHTHTLSADSL